MSVSPRRPIAEQLDTALSGPALFELFRNRPFPFFLDSSMDPEKLGRWSFMGADPFLTMFSRGDSVTITREGAAEEEKRGNPFDILGELLESYKLEFPETKAPFVGGAVGYLSYDLRHFIEKLPTRAKDDLHLPESYICFYDLIVARDNLMGSTWVFSSGFPEKDEERRLKRARQRMHEFRSGMIAAAITVDPPSSLKAGASSGLNGNFTHETYVRAVARARQYIIDGDIFEVNISQRFDTHIDVPPWELYRRLRAINPAPFAAYLGYGDLTVASASPERFLKVRGNRVETRPIKGTVRRGATPAEDRERARELITSVKDHAENMMIVDLERNDLGRVCRYGTVRVTELAILETFPTVFHLTSTVVGQLGAGKDRIDLLKATFPGGSITGAPKVRSMEIIDELEPTCRSVYTGNIGYFGFDGSMDLNIVIRTFIIKGNHAYFQVGGAVVYDSNPESEYQETLDKGRALVKALGLAEPE